MLLTDLVAMISGDLFHRILRWVGVEADSFHDWVNSHCPCGVFNELDEDEESWPA